MNPCIAEEKKESLLDKYEISIGYAPICKHWKDRAHGEYNEQNHAIMVTVNQWFGMSFWNSYDDFTIAAGYIFRTKKRELPRDFYIRGNLPAGAVYGYENRNFAIGDISFMALPIIEIGKGNFSFNTAVFPIVSVMFVYTF